MTEAILEMTDVHRVFASPRGAPEVRALGGVNLTIGAGEFVVVRGPSGSGKSTLLLTLGGMRRPSSGVVGYRGEDLYASAESRRRELRRGPIGFVFQEMHLLPYLDAERNVALARREGVRSSAREQLTELGLATRLTHRPAQLSAGERQRVAVARALMREPEVILADEPTGSLDPENAALVLARLAEFHTRGGTVVLVTHTADLPLPAAHRELRMERGRLD